MAVWDGESISLLVILLCGVVVGDNVYVLDDTPGLGRVFDGIGGLSGGGATSRLLVSYPEKQRNEILDYLFKPNFGASLHILKVEIGGDAQSTDGTETSYMHSATDVNYQRGYEWWLMMEAKKRNPDIKLYGLPWGFPAWVGGGSGSPYTDPETTATYVTNWIVGAKKFYNLTIDYVGIWNERNYNSTYIKTLRKTLDDKSLQGVQIVAPDGNFEDLSSKVLQDQDLSNAVSILGAHYPGTRSDDNAIKSGKQLWASEDYSTYNNDVGAGCWGRILNQNYVNGRMTSTISWNLIASYYSGLPYYRDGLMTAIEPWSGHYVDNGPIWISAHTTQFTRPGIHYLSHGNGVGFLNGGGSYVTFFDKETKDFTVVIETMSHNHSVCIRPPLPSFKVINLQLATFNLNGSLSGVKSLNQWISLVNENVFFKRIAAIEVVNDQFTVEVPVDTIITLTTLSGQIHGDYDSVPQSEEFPNPYKDSFEDYDEFSEARYFADQSGVFEIAVPSDENGNKVMQQVVTSRPITWCNDANQPISIIGNMSWVSANTSVMVRLEATDTSAFLAVGVNQGGCGIASANKGVYGIINSNDQWTVTSDLAMKKKIGAGTLTVKPNTWYKLSLDVDGTNTKEGTFTVDDVEVMTFPLPNGYAGGFIGLGTGGYYPVQYDNFTINYAA